MTSQRTHRMLNGATSQLDRLRGAPAPETVAVDGRGLAELLAFAADYGALITFYDLENIPQGDWSAFFAADPAVRLAMHAALDLPEIERALQRLIAESGAGATADLRLTNVRRVLTTLARLIGVLDRSHIEVGEGEALLQRFRGDTRDDALAEPLDRYHRHVGGDPLARSLARRQGWGDALNEILDDVAVTLLGELKRGTAGTLLALEASLRSGDHAPQAALWNAFVQLFIEARKTLNTFPSRLVDFYYGDILQQHSIDAEPDRLFLTFTPAQAAHQASVPRGAVFPAGTDAAGLAITYTTDNALEVTATTVTGLSVHRVTTAPDAGHAGQERPSGVLSGAVAFDPAVPAAMAPFPVFGTTKTGTFGPLQMKAASMGFSIASPTLMLTGGERVVQIGLVISQSASSEAVALAATELGTLRSGTSGSLMTFVAGLIEETFALHYTSAGGWVKVESFTVTPVEGAATMFSLLFTLPSDAPPLVALDTPPVGDPPTDLLPADTFSDPQKQPTVVASLLTDPDNHAAQKAWTAINQFAIVSKLEISDVTIDVTVSELRNVRLMGPVGPADTSQNFPVFGLPPVQHAALDIYAPELFVKPIESLSVSITWAGLPVTRGGFKGYYQDYVLDVDGAVSPGPLFDNASFRVGVEAINPGMWTVPETGTQPLFRTTPALPIAPAPSGTSTPPVVPEPMPAAPIDQTSIIAVPIKQTGQTPAYYNPEASAVRLTLAEPAYAFGNILYQNNMMAASMATAGQGAAVRVSSATRWPSASSALTALASANGTASDKGYQQSVAPAADAAISMLTGEALAAVRQAIAQSGAGPDARAALNASLAAALGDMADRSGSLWSRLTLRGGSASEASAVLANLTGWLAANEAAFGAGALVPLKQAHAILDAAGGIATSLAASSNQPAAVARPLMSAAIRTAQAGVLPVALPNAPWQPMACALSLRYTAAAHFSLADVPRTVEGAAQMVQLTATAANPDTKQISFLHVAPFDRTTVPPGVNDVRLLPRIDRRPALYIHLADPAPYVSLLFLLTAGPDGWWSKAPTLEWHEYVDKDWKEAVVLDDTTNSLSNSGIVRLKLARGGQATTRLRVRATGNTDNAPLVTAVIANAVSARWAGPGGATTLGVPLPAGTITKSETTLTNIGSIAQPMQSFGGRPPANGAGFQMWMAERLRHKGFAINDWDYARLVLEAEPSLWQAAVIPATASTTMLPAPGHVWIAAVPGPTTPNIADPTMPMADLTMLSDIGETIEACAGPFVQVSVTNPPYLPLRVTAELWFTDDDTASHWQQQLEADLIKWLSPWPVPAFGARPAHYYTKRAVTEFVRHRPYVRAVVTLDVAPDPSATQGKVAPRWYYFTAAKTHDLSGKTTPAGMPVPGALDRDAGTARHAE